MPLHKLYRLHIKARLKLKSAILYGIFLNAEFHYILYGDSNIYRQRRNQRIMVCIYHLLMAVLVNFWMKKDYLQIMLYKAMSLS